MHNLFGKKNDLVLAIFRGLVDNVEAVLSGPELADPIAASEAFIDRIVELYRSDQVFYRAAFMGGERLGCLSTIRAEVYLLNPSLWLKGYAPVLWPRDTFGVK